MQRLASRRGVLSLIGLILLVPLLARAAPVDNVRNRGLAWLLTHQEGDGSWRSAPDLDVPTTATALEALRRAGLQGYSSSAALAWLSQAPALSIDAQAR